MFGVSRPGALVRCGCLLLLVFGDSGCKGPDQPLAATILSAADARQHTGEYGTVEFLVRASKQEPDRPIHYLDSEVDWQHPQNFAVKIADGALSQFEKAGISHPATFFKGKKIQVTGQIVFEDDQYEIVVTEPLQIIVVD